MLVLRHRLAIAVVVAAAAVAVPVAALASGSGAPPAKTPPSTTAAAAAPSTIKSPPPGPQSPPDPAAVASKEAAAASQPDVVPAPVQAFASRLGVSTAAAGRAFKEVARLASQDGSVDTSSPAFADIAHELGVSQAQLAAAWNAVRPDETGK